MYVCVCVSFGGGGGGRGCRSEAHVQIFQLWFAMFSLALSALLEPGPEKLSIGQNSRLPLHPDWKKK